jgi:hypothetical protein
MATDAVECLGSRLFDHICRRLEATAKTHRFLAADDAAWDFRI